MTNLPSGTVTFLFTDVEGSTRLLQQLGDRFVPLIAELEQLLREVFRAYHGSVVRTEGDSFFVAFSRALDAVNAVVQSQQALAAHQWTNGVSVKVRMGMHTGEAQLSGPDYVGIDVHRAARIAGVAKGGQVLLSQTTYDLVEKGLPEGVTIRDLGLNRLKDLRRPTHLYQLVIAGLPSDFPPLDTMEGPPNNLPIQLTSFIGRSSEIEEIEQLLSSGRLLTLTGPGGSGKTRLAIKVAAEMLEDFPDGVFFVALAPITDPGLVASTIAQSLGVTEVAGRSIVDSLKDYLRSKSLLLLLDNFEQVISAAPLVSELFAVSNKLKVLVTSREALRISGEQEYPVPPLSLPDLSQLPSPESLSQFAAVELFVRRAQSVKPDFQITNETAPIIVGICHRLDGLPLAIELAAARIKLLPPGAMLARLEHRLEFLTGGKRDLPARQQTLRNTIAWSYDLLNEDERRLFRLLSVFVGGCNFDAVEAVTGNHSDHVPMLDQLGSLLDKSLLQEVEDSNGQPRFLMLGLLSEFGLEKLVSSGEHEKIRQRHVNFFLAFAEEAEANQERSEQIYWIDRMEQEHDNLRAALEWSCNSETSGDICLRLAGALGYFWEAHGYFNEGRERLSAVLSMEVAQGRTEARAKLLARAAELAFRQSDYPATISLAAESLSIYREVGDLRGTASALIRLGNAATEVGDYATASRYLEESLIIWRKLEDKHGIARALISSGWTVLRSGDYLLAYERLEEALSISRVLGDTRTMGFELAGLGEVAMRQGDYPRATRLVEESLELRRQLGNKWGVGVSLGILGWVALRERDWDRAVARFSESLEVRREIGDEGGSAWCLERLAEVAMEHEQAEKAVRLISAAATLRDSIGSVIDHVDLGEYESNLASLRGKLGEERFSAAWDEGSALTLEQAADYAVQN